MASPAAVEKSRTLVALLVSYVVLAAGFWVFVAGRVAGRIGGWAELLGERGRPVLVNGALGLLLMLCLLYLALQTHRLRVGTDGVHEWTWRGWRHLRWTDVTSASVERIPGGTALDLWAGNRRWRLTSAQFKDPKAAFAFVTANLPPPVQSLVSAA